MKSNEFHEIVLNQLKGLQEELKEVRQTDIPDIKTSIAGFQSQLDAVKSSQTWTTRIYTVIGGAVAVMIAKFTGGSH